MKGRGIWASRMLESSVISSINCTAIELFLVDSLSVHTDSFFMEKFGGRFVPFIFCILSFFVSVASLTARTFSHKPQLHPPGMSSSFFSRRRFLPFPLSFCLFPSHVTPTGLSVSRFLPLSLCCVLSPHTPFWLTPLAPSFPLGLPHSFLNHYVSLPISLSYSFALSHSLLGGGSSLAIPLSPSQCF